MWLFSIVEIYNVLFYQDLDFDALTTFDLLMVYSRLLTMQSNMEFATKLLLTSNT